MSIINFNLSDFDKEMIEFLFPGAKDISPRTLEATKQPRRPDVSHMVLMYNGYVINVHKSRLYYTQPLRVRPSHRPNNALSININNDINLSITEDKITIEAKALIESIDLKNPNSLEYTKKLIHKLMEPHG